MPTYTDQDIQDLLAEFDLTVPDLSSRLNAVEGKIITVATGADVTDYGQVELISKLESDAAEVRANTYTDNQLLAAAVDILNQADLDSQSKYDAIEAITKAYTDGAVTSAEEAAAITATARAALAELNAKAYADGVITDSEAASIAASEARAELAETLAKAYADGIVTAAEANAIAEAEIKAQTLADIALIAAKDYADNIVVTAPSEFEDFIKISNRDIAILNDKTTDTEVRELLMLAEDAAVKFKLETNTFILGNTESNISTLNVQSLNYTSQLNQINHSTTGILAQANSYTYTGTGYWSGGTWHEGPISQRIRDLKVTTGNGNAKLSEITEVFEDVGAGKFIARGGMITDVNGNLAGYVSTNDGSTSNFDIISSAFRVGEWVGGSFDPYLEASGDGLTLSGSVITDRIQLRKAGQLQLAGNPTVWAGIDVNMSDSVVNGLAFSSIGGISINGDFTCSGSGTGDFQWLHTKNLQVNGVAVPFTAAHVLITPKNVAFQIGSLLSKRNLITRIDVNNALFTGGLTETARERTVLGACSSTTNIIVTERIVKNDDNSFSKEAVYPIKGLDAATFESIKRDNMTAINCIGEGLLLVCAESGDIHDGQWLCSSSLAGHAMLQTDELTGEYEKYFTDYTVAQACEDVVWANEPSNEKLIAVYYKGG